MSSSSSPKKKKKKKVSCWKGANCNNPECPYNHDCFHGGNCRDPRCKYRHPTIASDSSPSSVVVVGGGEEEDPSVTATLATTANTIGSPLRSLPHDRSEEITTAAPAHADQAQQQSSEEGQQEGVVLLKFLASHVDCLKCTKEEYFSRLRSEDIVCLEDLADAVNDVEYLNTLCKAGLKKYKVATFKEAAAIAAAAEASTDSAVVLALRARIDELESHNQSFSIQLGARERNDELNEQQRMALATENSKLQDENINLQHQIQMLSKNNESYVAELTKVQTQLRRAQKVKEDLLESLRVSGTSIENLKRERRTFKEDVTEQMRAESSVRMENLSREKEKLARKVQELEQQLRVERSQNNQLSKNAGSSFVHTFSSTRGSRHHQQQSSHCRAEQSPPRMSDFPPMQKKKPIGTTATTTTTTATAAHAARTSVLPPTSAPLRENKKPLAAPATQPTKKPLIINLEDKPKSSASAAAASSRCLSMTVNINNHEGKAEMNEKRDAVVVDEKKTRENEAGDEEKGRSTLSPPPPPNLGGTVEAGGKAERDNEVSSTPTAIAPTKPKPAEMGSGDFTRKPRRKDFSIPNDLTTFLFSGETLPTRRVTASSPIFALLSGDKEAVSDGRKLLQYEHNIRVLKQEVDELEIVRSKNFGENERLRLLAGAESSKFKDRITKLEDEIRALYKDRYLEPTGGGGVGGLLGSLFGKDECSNEGTAKEGGKDPITTVEDAAVIAKQKQSETAAEREARKKNVKTNDDRKILIRGRIRKNKQKRAYNEKLKDERFMATFTGDKKKLEEAQRKEEVVTREDAEFLKEEIEKEIESERKRFDANYKKTIEAIGKMNEKITSHDKRLKIMRGEVESERAKISDLKGNGMQEDDSHDINASKNALGHTFLMVSVLRDDLETAQLCLKLGARPDEVCGINGLTATIVASYFRRDYIVSLLQKYGATFPSEEMDIWEAMSNRPDTKSEVSMDWQVTLNIANSAAIPSDTLLCKAAALEANEDERMPILTDAEKSSRCLKCFDASLTGKFEEGSFLRTILIEKEVFSWFRKNQCPEFLALLEFLVPDGILEHSSKTKFVCERRAVVGMQHQYEVLAVPIRGSLTVLFTPFVTNANEGRHSCGALIWAVVDEKEASLYKALLQKMEFLRTKVDTDDRFPGHLEYVLELGKDMHLLDLKTTSVYNCRPMELFVLNVDDGELELLAEARFTPKKRTLDYEEKLSEAIFRSSQKETKANQELLSGASDDRSTQLSGGAGTGKTLLISKKVISENANERILVVTRLPRLLSAIKSAVEKERSAQYVKFSTYDDLLGELARKVEAPEGEKRYFAMFSQVQYGGTTGTGETSSVSFVDGFIQQHLNESDRKSMKQHRLEPLTLYTAFRVIKSNIRCLQELEPLSRDDYLTLPAVFGLDQSQRTVAYDYYELYEKWLADGSAKWDEADRVTYVLKWAHEVFSEIEFSSWQTRYFHGRGEGVVDDDGMPLRPFFFHKVFVDEAQDFSELDLALLVRMSKSSRSLFVAADPAQSVELGLNMLRSTFNAVINSSLPIDTQVKDVLQCLSMRINHRTHEQNLALSKTIRKLLTRSFKVSGTEERALLRGHIPEVMLLKSVTALADENTFKGANIVIIVPDENVRSVRSLFREKNILSDVFGVREAKGLEFDSVALLGFFEHFEKTSRDEWVNSLRWLSSEKGLTVTESSELVKGKRLESCDYLLSHPELQDEAAMLYTALTRARNRLYLFECGADGKENLASFAFRCFEDLGLVKRVVKVDEGQKEMTAQQHKARGVLYVNQAIELDERSAPISAVQEKFEEARKHFMPQKGNDKHLLDQCTKHMEVVLMKRSLLKSIKTKFFNKDKGIYELDGKFTHLLQFEKELAKFFSYGIDDSFLFEDMREVVKVVDDMFRGSLYYNLRFEDIFDDIRQRLQ